MGKMKNRELYFLFTLISLILVCLSGAGCEPAINVRPTVINTASPQATETQPESTPEEAATSDPFETDRIEMVRIQIMARGVEDENVVAAMRKVPRHHFVLDRYLGLAYSDSPLPIDHGQTISQPYIVALMTELLDAEPGDRVLEIGTGSGYQAAVLAEMGFDTYSIEIIPELAEQATKRLQVLGYANVKVLNADGYYGWEEYQPFQAIIVTAAPDHLPQPLINQLADHGRLVIPIGPVGAVQTLWLFEKTGGEIQATNMGGVRFVPLTGEH
jgi:protein-L-isoaspartate(D-aspartate) O-methyltransferase